MYIGQAEMAVSNVRITRTDWAREDSSPGENACSANRVQTPRNHVKFRCSLFSDLHNKCYIIAQTCSHTQACTYFFKVTDCGSKKRDKE